MNHNRSHDYENYKNSYGIRELFREAGEARRLRDSESDSLSGAVKVKRIALRLSPVVIVAALLIRFFG